LSDDGRPASARQNDAVGPRLLLQGVQVYDAPSRGKMGRFWRSPRPTRRMPALLGQPELDPRRQRPPYPSAGPRPGAVTPERYHSACEERRADQRGAERRGAAEVSALVESGASDRARAREPRSFSTMAGGRYVPSTVKPGPKSTHRLRVARSSGATADRSRRLFAQLAHVLEPPWLNLVRSGPRRSGRKATGE
jgi:hypothetical protein